MKGNMGKIDRVIRVVISLLLFGSFFLLEGNIRYFSILGFVPLLTGVISFCPLYHILGIKTCGKKEGPADDGPKEEKKSA